MDFYISRQPIFDSHMNIYGYELLYRQNDKNYFIETDDDTATTELIYNSFLVVGLNDLTDGTKAFINFSKDLINSQVPYLLPKGRVVFEILERMEATQETIETCEKMRALGYELALDDFVMDDSFLPLIDKVDIIKVEYPSVSYSDQRSFIEKLRSKSKVKFLAEKIETREDYQRAVDIGYDYFQGYFFSKPAMVNSKEIAALSLNLFSILERLEKPEPSYPEISDIIQRDLGLTYKLLKLANSVYIGSRYKINSIPQALTYIGIRELRQWISLMLLKEMQNVENAEMIKLSLVRGKLMELIAAEFDCVNNPSEYFFTGMFSFIDVLMNQPMNKLLEGLPFSHDVKQALLGEENALRQLLNSIINCESADWNDEIKLYPLNMLGSTRFIELYMESLKWAKKLNY